MPEDIDEGHFSNSNLDSPVIADPERGRELMVLKKQIIKKNGWYQ